MRFKGNFFGFQDKVEKKGNSQGLDAINEGGAIRPRSPSGFEPTKVMVEKLYDIEVNSPVFKNSPVPEEEILGSIGCRIFHKKLLGRGAFGIVMEAKVKEIPAAVKVMSGKREKKMTESDFKTETLVMTIARKRKHPYIIHCLASAVIDDNYFIFMELADSELISFLRVYAPLKEDRAQKYFKEIIEGLRFIHGLGYAHRDLKGGNILLKKVPSGGQDRRICKISDFGLSRIFLQEGRGMGKSMSFCGTRQYMAPEVMCMSDRFDKSNLCTQRPYDAMQADIWAMGVILYQMIFRAYPFNSLNEEAMMKQMLGKGYILSKKGPGKHSYMGPASEQVISLIQKMLEPDPYMRISLPGILDHPWYQTISPLKSP